MEDRVPAPATRREPSPVPPSERPNRSWTTPLALFLITAASVFYTGVVQVPGGLHFPPARDALVNGAEFAGTLLTILLFHEFGHYIAARIHGVPATLPYFIPLPFFSPFGTMGAVIQIKDRITTRRALLDIGAAGPLAGLAVAIPLYAWGSAHSTVVPVNIDDASGQLLGESLLSKLLDHLFAPHFEAGFDLLLSPVAFAAWTGFFVTMVNLIPAAQLDGGHVAYALLGPRQNRVARWVHRSMLAFFLVGVVGRTIGDLASGLALARMGHYVQNSLFWFVWFEMLAVIGSLAQSKERDPATTISPRVRIGATIVLVATAGEGAMNRYPAAWLGWFAGLAMLLIMEARGGALTDSPLLDHPATDDNTLGTGRSIVAVVTLAFFILLFMPAPFIM